MAFSMKMALLGLIRNILVSMLVMILTDMIRNPTNALVGMNSLRTEFNIFLCIELIFRTEYELTEDSS